MNCEYCEREVNFNWEDEIELDYTSTSLGIDQNGVYIRGYETADKWYVNYCPVCGRQVRKPRKYNIEYGRSIEVEEEQDAAD